MEDGALLAALPGYGFAFALVLCRVGALVMLLPGIGESEPPATVRAGLALALAFLLFPAAEPSLRAAPEGWDALGTVAGELLAGGVLGWLARLPVLALSMAGAVISYMVGLSSVVQPDPALGGQSAALSRAMGMAAPLLVLSTGLYELPLSALAGSYQVIPPGAAVPSGPVLEMVQAALSAAFGLAIRLSAPFILASLLLQCGLGLLARLAPQLQVFSASAPGQILGGLVLLGALTAPLLAAWTDAVTAAWSVLPGL